VGLAATDDDGATDTDTATVTVNEPAPSNRPPVVNRPIPDRNAPANRRFHFALAPDTFVDPDVGQTLTYTATQSDGSSLPGWLTFDRSARVFRGRPLIRHVGSYAIRVTATDSGSPAMSAYADFTIVVTAPAFSRQNADLPADVDGNDYVTAVDALILANQINSQKGGALAGTSPDSADGSLAFVDVNGDDFLSPGDLLVVLSYLNRMSSGSTWSPEGEAASDAASAPKNQPSSLAPSNAASRELFTRYADSPIQDDGEQLFTVLAKDATRDEHLFEDAV
jgi:hypothetical protein